MKTKKIISAILASALAATAVVSASAATLTDVTPENSVEVKAKIVNPGDISYTITIPDSADFGELTMPENTDTDHYVFSDFNVTATELNIRSNQAVTVYMKDSCSDFGTDGQFCISQKDAADPFKINYDIYASNVDESNIGTSTAINSSGTPGSYGYHLCTFNYGTQGTKTTGTLALNQNALYGKTLSAIAGDYSGTIVFHSALVER
ncbi:MAG: hypothetical protein PUG48_11855 [Clostridia bacterium]|nr:hypothetical protein [Clostridia bacterium]